MRYEPPSLTPVLSGASPVRQAALLTVWLAGPAAAQASKGYLNIESGDLDFSGPLKWIIIVAVLGGIGHLGYYLWTTKRKQYLQQRAASLSKSERSERFQDRAATLGFRAGEARTVEKIAVRLAPKSPLNLLNTGSGREYLMSDLDRRIRRRTKEIRVLERIGERLKALRDSDVHERGSVRVEANISVWVSRRGVSKAEMAALVEDEDDAEGEAAEAEDQDLFDNLDSVDGRLIDISEGGAAIETDLSVERGDQLVFWSGDPHVILGETRAGVVSIEAGETAPVLHVHFIDPDLRDVRGAILQLRGEDVGEEA